MAPRWESERFHAESAETRRNWYVLENLIVNLVENRGEIGRSDS